MPPDPGLGAPETDPVDQLIAMMTIEQKVAQRFVVWMPGTALDARTSSLIERGVGGVILSRTNVTDTSQIRQLTAALRTEADASPLGIGLFIGADQEGGRVARFRFHDVTQFPAAYYWAAHGDEVFVESASYVQNVELRALGANMNFAPVLDLYGHPDSSIIGDRSFGDDPAKVAGFAEAYLRGARRAGVIAVLKHFPGHGASIVDTHHQLPVVSADARALDRGLDPFRAAIDAGAEAMMTAHIVFEALDAEHPATLSAKILHDLLRDELGFTGLAISDAIEMRALTASYQMDEILTMAINAGIDAILVVSALDPGWLIDRGAELVRRGRITEERLDSGVRRILATKSRHGLLPP